MPRRTPIPLSTEFEQLVATIVGELEPTARVKWNDRIPGKRSGRTRQIDVSIRRTDPDFLGIIDAKHYRRAATIDRVDALTGVMRDVGANYGALVCSAGFSKTMYGYARNVGVSLFNIHDAESMIWSMELTIPILWTELTPMATLDGILELQAGDSIDTADPLGIRVTADGGVTVLDPVSTLKAHWNGVKAARTPGVQHRFTHDQPVQAVVLDASGKRSFRPAHHLAFTYVVETKTWLGRFQPRECRGLVAYLDQASFIASYLPDGQVPIQRDESWIVIDHPDKLGLVPHGTVVVAQTPMVINDLKFEQFHVERIGPIPNRQS